MIDLNSVQSKGKKQYQFMTERLASTKAIQQAKANYFNDSYKDLTQPTVNSVKSSSHPSASYTSHKLPKITDLKHKQLKPVLMADYTVSFPQESSLTESSN